MYKLIESIECFNNEGQKRIIDVYQEQIPVTTFSGKSTIDGLLWFKCGSKSVNRIDQNTFEIVSTGEIVKRQ